VKPVAVKPIAQLTIYALALTRLIPGLKLFDIKCAWFNETCYNEFFPRLLLPRRTFPSRLPPRARGFKIPARLPAPASPEDRHPAE
jgi:hypothetical protein